MTRNYMNHDRAARKARKEAGEETEADKRQAARNRKSRDNYRVKQRAEKKARKAAGTETEKEKQQAARDRAWRKEYMKTYREKQRLQAEHAQEESEEATIPEEHEPGQDEAGDATPIARSDTKGKKKKKHKTRLQEEQSKPSPDSSPPPPSNLFHQFSALATGVGKDWMHGLGEAVQRMTTTSISRPLIPHAGRFWVRNRPF